ncbi:MAG: CBS domain-containing protein, partial [Sphingomicrobium sp.]
MSIAAILSAKGNEVASIAGDAPLSAAVAQLGTRRIGALLVMDGSEIKGILSERDLVYSLKEHGSEVLDWPVSRAM